jgi:SAM-dependent methyltransferase
MTQSAPENEAQREYWNKPGGSVWTEWQERMDLQLAPLGHAALDAMQLQPGERIIDVGCGCGDTTLQVATAIGREGTVVGLDISEPMLARATQRSSSLPNISFVAADAQVVSVEQLGGPADGIVSRFGVMFFADPVAAFTNMLSFVRPGGRLSFVCWQAPVSNSWMSMLGRELASMFPGQPPVDPTAPGPFAFADPDRVRTILGAAGWSDVTVAPCVRAMKLFGTDDFQTAVEGSLRLGGAGRLLVGATDEQKLQARGIAETVMRSMWTEGGGMVEGSCWVVTARR